MRKITLLISTILISLSLFAEGYQVNLLSTKQTGMGHVGVGMKLKSESMLFNPAGMVWMEKPIDMSVGLSMISSKATYKSSLDAVDTDNPLGTPIYAYLGYKVYDNLAIGLAYNTPYGNSLKWPKSWAGAHLIQDIKLQSHVFQPTISYKITDRLSIGGGLMVAVGNVNLSRALMGVKDFQTIGGIVEGIPDEVLPPAQKDPIVGVIKGTKVAPGYARLKGTSDIRMGFNVGLMIDMSEKVTLGVSYRSKIKMKVKEGDAELTYANRQVEDVMNMLGNISPALSVPKYNQGTFRAELPLPANLTAGVSYRPTEKLQLALDLQLVGWAAYDSLNVHFNEEELGIAPILAEKDYKNTFIIRTGVEYNVYERLDLRAGVYYDQSPIRKENYNPETPGMDKLGFSVGASFAPYERFQIHLALLYIQGLSRDGSYTSRNIVTGDMDVFAGRYSSSAFTASIGASYSF